MTAAPGTAAAPSVVLVDTHAHLSLPVYAEDRDAVVERARAAGVARCVVVAASLAESRATADVAAAYPGYRASVGIGPHDAAMVTEDVLAELAGLAQRPLVCAYGEIGLDYHYFREESERDTQRQAMAEQLALAQRLNLPVIFHLRDAAEDFWRIVDRVGLPERGGVMHCFTGDLACAQAACERGLSVSFSGMVTFRKAAELRAVVQAIPDDRLLLETDSPYLAPEGHRGQRCEPAFLHVTAQCVATLRHQDLTTLADITTVNAARLFGLTSKAHR